MANDNPFFIVRDPLALVGGRERGGVRKEIDRGLTASLQRDGYARNPCK